MADWKTIDTVPNDRIVEIATFPLPAGAHVKNWTLGADIRAAFPAATHWREVTAETVEGITDAARDRRLETVPPGSRVRFLRPADDAPEGWQFVERLGPYTVICEKL